MIKPIDEFTDLYDLEVIKLRAERDFYLFPFDIAERIFGEHNDPTLVRMALKYHEPKVVASAILHLPGDEMLQEIHHDDSEVRETIACRAPDEVKMALANDPDEQVRCTVANSLKNIDYIVKFFSDKSSKVVMHAVTNHNLSYSDLSNYVGHHNDIVHCEAVEKCAIGTLIQALDDNIIFPNRSVDILNYLRESVARSLSTQIALAKTPEEVEKYYGYLKRLDNKQSGDCEVALKACEIVLDSLVSVALRPHSQMSDNIIEDVKKQCHKALFSDNNFAKLAAVKMLCHEVDPENFINDKDPEIREMALNSNRQDIIERLILDENNHVSERACLKISKDRIPYVFDKVTNEDVMCNLLTKAKRNFFMEKLIEGSVRYPVALRVLRSRGDINGNDEDIQDIMRSDNSRAKKIIEMSGILEDATRN